MVGRPGSQPGAGVLDVGCHPVLKGLGGTALQQREEAGCIVSLGLQVLWSRVAEKSNPSNLDCIQIEISASNFMTKIYSVVLQNGYCHILRLYF